MKKESKNINAKYHKLLINIFFVLVMTMMFVKIMFL